MANLLKRLFGGGGDCCGAKITPVEEAEKTLAGSAGKTPAGKIESKNRDLKKESN